ncbi:MAG: ABC transporter ATP-binding protein [Acetobacterales bacterium]
MTEATHPGPKQIDGAPPSAADGREVVIRVRNLVKSYGPRTILKGIDLDIHDREVMVIMGGSGSGKSTLLRHLMALEQPTSGSIDFLGRDLCRMSGRDLYDIRKRMGVAFQGGALLSSLTVGENIMLPLREHTDLDEQTMRVMMRLKLEVVELAGFEDLIPSELSGGMLKRAAFARAVIMDPRLLFCDEPSAGLDPVVSSALDDLILRLRDALGITIVVVTHELESAFKIADRITFLDRGEIIMVGSVDEVRNSRSERVQNLLNRRAEHVTLDVDEYLARLTGENLPADAP